MKIKRTINHYLSTSGMWNAGIMILFLMLALPMTYLLTGCKSSELQPAQPGEAITVTFDLLSGYDYDKEQIPDLVKSLNGQRVAVTGFMLPDSFDGDAAKSFLLLRNQMGCCFGITPRVNDFVYVDMRGGRVAKYIMDIPITVVGKFEVSKNLLVNSIYRVEAENVLVTDGF